MNSRQTEGGRSPQAGRATLASHQAPAGLGHAEGIPNAVIDCDWCGTSCKADASDTMGEWAPVRIELGICDICAIGEDRARKYAEGRGTKWLIIEGNLYSPRPVVPLGQPDPQPGTPSDWKGFGGARFDFQRDGEEPQTTYSMWHGGTVREQQKERMPDNGRFLTREEVAQRIEARSDETLQAARPEGQEPDGNADAP